MARALNRYLKLAALLCAAILPMSAAHAVVTSDDDVTLVRSIAGNVQFVATGGTLRTGNNGGLTACDIVNGNDGTGTDTRAIGDGGTNDIPAGSTIAGAYLYWNGSWDSTAEGGLDDSGAVPEDYTVTLEGTSFTAAPADRYNAVFNFNLGNGAIDFEFFTGVADVTSLVSARANPNGNYTFGGLQVENDYPHCHRNNNGNPETTIAAWALVIIYNDPNEPTRVVNMFEGLQMFRASSTTITPSNFITPANPDGRIGVLTWEGDAGNSQDSGGFSEALTVKGTALTNAANPASNQFNSTVSGPGTPTPTGGTVNSVDFDVYDISALLDPAGGETTLPTTYASGNDLIMLTLQISAVENEPVTDLELDKTDNGATFTVGSTGSYDFTVTNNGPNSVIDTITVTDTLPTGLTYTGFTGTGWSCGVSGQDVTCTHAPLSVPNDGLDYPLLTINVNVTANPSSGSTFENSATVSLPANASSFDNVAGNNTDTESTPVPSADVRISKIDSADPVATNDNFFYTIIVNNDGPQDALDVQVVDVLPGSLTFTSVVQSQGSCSESSGTVTCLLGTIAANGAASIGINVVTSGTAGPVTNTATVTTTTYDPDNANDSDSETTSVVDVNGDSCYLVADESGGNGGNDLLSIVDTGDLNTATNEVVIGTGTGTNDIEAIAWDANAGILYAADADELGTINVSTGVYTPIGVFGTANDGAAGSIALNDVDGLAFDSTTNTLYGTHRRGGGHLLIQIDTTTGAHIDRAFGTTDYIVFGISGGLGRSDDFAVHPVTGQMYALASAAQGDPASLMTVNKDTGAVSIIGALGVNQVQGLGFNSDGSVLYASNGSATEEVFSVSTVDGSIGTQIGLANGGTNYEAIDCPHNTPAIGVDLQVQKTVDDPAPLPNDTIQYTVTVSHVSGGRTNAVEVTDALPSGVTFVSFTATQGEYDDATGIWHVGTLSSSDVETLTITATVDAAASGVITNTASLTRTSQPDNVTANNSDTADITLAEAADLELVKTDSADPVAKGSTFAYTLTITNNGSGDAVNTVVTDTLPGTVTFQSAVPSVGSCSESGGTVTCNLGTLANAAVETVNIVVTAPADPGDITNTASVTSDTADGVPGNNSDSETTTINNNVNQLCYAVADAGGGNGGNDLLTIIDTSDFNNATNETNVGTGTGTNGIEAIAWDPINEILYAADADELGTINLTTGVYTTIGSFGTGAHSTLGNQAFNDVDSLTFAADGTLWGAERNGTGSDLLFQINPATGAHVNGAFPSGNDYEEITVLDGLNLVDDIAIDRTTGVMYGVINNGGSTDRLVTINLNTAVATYVTNVDINFSDVEGLGTDSSGQLWATTGSGNPNGQLFELDKTNGVGSFARSIDNGGDYESVDCYAVAPSASVDIAVVKDVDDPEPQVGENAVYTLTITNNGPSTATALQIQDLLPTGVTYVSSAATQGVYDPSQGLWFIGSIVASQTVSLDITASVDAGTQSTTITNTASLFSVTQVDTVSANNSDTADITPPSASLLVLKTSVVEYDPFNLTNNPLRIPGAYIRYTIRVTNTDAGQLDTDSLFMTDPIPSNTALFVGDLNGASSGPVVVVDGDNDDGMTYSFTSLSATPVNLPNDDVDFSNNNGSDWNYVPIPDADGFDSLVTNIRVNPKGQFPGSPGGNNPDFDIQFRVRID